MKTVLSPKEFAEAIGVSESSMKRWADDGLLRVSRTAGGHRRIALSEAIRFVRERNATLVKPDLLGLTDLPQDRPQDVESASERLFHFLQRGMAREARGLVLSLYLSGTSVAEICDGPIRVSMARIGDLWQHDDAGIFVEHRATDICLQALNQLRMTVEPSEGTQIAIGGAPARDPYLLPSLAASTVLSSVGFRAINLGADTPTSVLMRAVQQYSPRLVWLSVSTSHDPAGLSSDLTRFAEKLALDAPHTHLAVGGRATRVLELPQDPRTHEIQSLEQLAALGQELLAP